MSAYERFRKDIDDGLYDDQDPTKRSTEDLERETGAAIAGGAMSHEESRLLLFRYIDWMFRRLTGRRARETMTAQGVMGRDRAARYDQ